MKNLFNFLKRNQVGILYGVGAGVVINNLSDGRSVWIDEITNGL